VRTRFFNLFFQFGSNSFVFSFYFIVGGLINTFFGTIAVASSVFTDYVEKYGPNYAIDGLVSDGDTKIFLSEKEIQPWFQMEFVEAMVLKGVTYTNRKDCCGERFQNVTIRVGDEAAEPGGALVTNPECAIFVGPSATGMVEQIMCTEPLVGRYLQVQMRDTSNQWLQINQIEVVLGNSMCKFF
jgi:hypothetical protein